jgi:hypothetical protein
MLGASSFLIAMTYAGADGVGAEVRAALDF